MSVIDALARFRAERAVTPVTPPENADVTPKPAPRLAVTPVTPVTPENHGEPTIQDQAQARITAACRELGADVGSALNWYSDPGDWGDFASRPMEWVRLVVADGMEQGFIRRTDARAPEPDQERDREPGPLGDLDLLPEDWRFVRARTLGRQNRAALLDGYRRAWLDAADREPVPHRKDNVGRRAANTWLLNETDNREADHG